MFMGFVALLIFASAVLAGGKLSHLTALRVRYAWVIIACLAVQILISNIIPSAPKPLLVAAHLATYAAAAFVLWVNRALPGLVILGIGTLSNAIVIMLNGGTLPASARALADAGWQVDPKDFANSGVLAHPVLPWLGDIVATPAWLPFRNVISVGDMLILVGAFVLVHAVSRSRLWLLVARPGKHRKEIVAVA